MKSIKILGKATRGISLNSNLFRKDLFIYQDLIDEISHCRTVLSMTLGAA